MEKKMKWMGLTLSGLAAFIFAFSAVMKFSGGAQVVEGFNHFGFPSSMLIPLGILEITCVVIYLIPMTEILGAILLTGYLGGAIVTHLRVGEMVFLQVAIGIFVWLGLYLREPRLRALIPIRKP